MQQGQIVTRGFDWVLAFFEFIFFTGKKLESFRQPLLAMRQVANTLFTAYQVMFGYHVALVSRALAG